MSTDVRDLLQDYFNALNDRDIRACLALVSDELILQPNQGFTEHGRDAFAAFLERQLHCYREMIESLVIWSSHRGDMRPASTALSASIWLPMMACRRPAGSVTRCASAPSSRSSTG